MACCAVIVEPLRPKETLFEFEKTTVPRLLLVVPAEKLTGLGPPTAVTTDPARPNETPPALPKVMADMLLEVVPAETLTAVIPPPPPVPAGLSYPIIELKPVLEVAPCPPQAGKVGLRGIFWRGVDDAHYDQNQTCRMSPGVPMM